MHALVLAVNLAAAAGGAAAAAELEPAFAQAAPGGGASSAASAPDAPSLGAAAEQRRGLRVGEWAAASGVVVAGDVLLLGAAAVGFVQAVPLGSGAGSSSAAGALFAAAALGYVFLPPALAVLGARLAGAPPERSGRAYLYGFLVRVAAMGAMSLALRSSEQLALATWLGSELVLMPYVVASTLGNVPVSAPAAPLALALPVRDPALAR